MGNLSTATYKETLKQYAYGVAQDVKSALADFIAPRVPVGVGTGMFKKFDDKNAFQRYDTARAVGGPATRIEFAISATWAGASRSSRPESAMWFSNPICAAAIAAT